MNTIGLAVVLVVFGGSHLVACRCPAGATNWYEKDGSCYKFFRKEESWDQARLQCAFEVPDSDLASLGSVEELTYVHTMVHAQTVLGCSKRYWVGLSDRQAEATFTWVDGSAASFTNWARREPNNVLGEDCVEMSYDEAQWNDENCSRKRCFVCEVASS